MVLLPSAVVAPRPSPIAARARLKPYFKPRPGFPTDTQKKLPFVLRTFVRDGHLAAIQHIENRGMYKEELNIDRWRFPKFSRTVVIQTDGSMNEREFEFVVPPMVVLFYDRVRAHRARQLQLRQLEKLRKRKTWEATEVPEEPDAPMCNLTCFPYCVPSTTPIRFAKRDPLSLSRRGVYSEED